MANVAVGSAAEVSSATRVSALPVPLRPRMSAGRAGRGVRQSAASAGGQAEPIPETREVLEQMLQVGEDRVSTELLRMSRRAVEIVPECVGMSLALFRHGLTFTLASSSELVAGLDAVQYLDGG